MDPLSIIAALLAIVATTTHAVRFAKDRLKKVRQAKEAAGDLLDLLEALRSSLEALKKFLRAESRQSFSSTSALFTYTRSCGFKLNALCQKLKETEKHRFQFQWPLSTNDQSDTLQELRDIVQWIQFAISIDGMTILSKTSNDVIEILSHQLQTIRLIHKLDQRTEASFRAFVNIEDRLAASDEVLRRKNVLDWLSKISQQEKHDSIRALHTHGTGQWLLQNPVFQLWRDQPLGQGSLLWCHGPPGSGKTLLVAQSELPRELSDFYVNFKAGSSTAQREPLIKMLSLTSKAFAKTFVVVDALDECDTYTRNGFLQLVGSLQTFSRILVASRDFQESIVNAFQTSPQLKINADSSDIRSYILSTISESNQFVNIVPALRDEIADKITQSSQDM
ncbi:MAG: hypothetical protein Q9183_001762 [Haloplaca sp. 2 TL-2023]